LRGAPPRPRPTLATFRLCQPAPLQSAPRGFAAVGRGASTRLLPALFASHPHVLAAPARRCECWGPVFAHAGSSARRRPGLVLWPEECWRGPRFKGAGSTLHVCPARPGQALLAVGSRRRVWVSALLSLVGFGFLLARRLLLHGAAAGGCCAGRPCGCGSDGRAKRLLPAPHWCSPSPCWRTGRPWRGALRSGIATRWAMLWFSSPRDWRAGRLCFAPGEISNLGPGFTAVCANSTRVLLENGGFEADALRANATGAPHLLDVAKSFAELSVAEPPRCFPRSFPPRRFTRPAEVTRPVALARSALHARCRVRQRCGHCEGAFSSVAELRPAGPSGRFQLAESGSPPDGAVESHWWRQ